MKPEQHIDLAVAEETIETNLLGPIRLSAALLPHLLAQPRAALVTVSSGLAFVPLAATPVYSATKAAIHSWSMALRQQLKDSTVEVIEIAPPYVQTELLGPHQATDPDAMPLAEFTTEVMAILEAAPASGEVIVERCKPLRFAAENGNFAEVFAAEPAPLKTAIRHSRAQRSADPRSPPEMLGSSPSMTALAMTTGARPANPASCVKVSCHRRSRPSSNSPPRARRRVR